jgi:hypothetical protein
MISMPDFVVTVGDFAQLGDGVVKVAALGRVPHCRAVESAVEQLFLSGHAQAYRIRVRLSWAARVVAELEGPVGSATPTTGRK